MIDDIRTWCALANAGDYLATYEDWEDEHPGEVDRSSSCGYSDSKLDDIARLLGWRGLTLRADDRGLRVVAQEEA